MLLPSQMSTIRHTGDHHWCRGSACRRLRNVMQLVLNWPWPYLAYRRTGIKMNFPFRTSLWPMTLTLLIVCLWRCRRNRIWKQSRVNYETMSWKRFAVSELQLIVRDSFSKYPLLRCTSCIRQLQTFTTTSEVPTPNSVAKQALTTASVRWLPAATKG